MKLNDVPFFQRPIGPMQETGGVDELGNPVHRNGLTGAQFAARPQQPQQREGSALRQLWEALRTKPVETAKAAATGAAQGVWDGVSAPARAARGETVTHGDAWATALDYGALGAPMRAPEGALRSVALRGGGMSDPTQTGWTFRDAGRPPELSRSENKAISSGMKSGTPTVLPIRSMYATQPRVNADFDATETSAGMLPVVIRKDGNLYVRDGHHRLTKVAEEGGQNARVELIDFDNADTSTPLLDYDPLKAARQRQEMEDILADLDLFDDPQGTSGDSALRRYLDNIKGN